MHHDSPIRIALRRLALVALCITLAPLAGSSAAADKPSAPDAKPKAAFFPIGGDADAALRTQITFSFRLKLDRDGHYEVIDGPRMKDIAAEAKSPLTFDTPPADLLELNKLLDADVLVWGDMDKGNHLRIRILDLRDKNPKPRDMMATIAKPTQLRFISENILETLAGVGKFEHPTEVSLTDDAQSQELWKKNPNLVKNGTFADPGEWSGIYESEYYPVKISDALPAADKVCIYKLPSDNPAGAGATSGAGDAIHPESAHNALAMRLSKECAENNGLACLSASIKIEPDTRYRISFRYKSDGPTLHVFVKGYTTGQDIKGASADREVYRRQVPPSGKTDGKWVTVVDDLNPQNISWPVETLKIDLYAYLHPGLVMFEDVQLKAVGAQTHHAHDDAIKKPVTRPAREQ